MQNGSRPDVPRSEHVAMVVRVLAESGLDSEGLGEGRVMTVLAGEHKRTIPVLLTVGDTSLALVSLFTGRPDEGHASVYDLLLHRNEKSRWVHFALDDEGDLVLTGRIPLRSLDEALLGEVLGELLAVADSTFDQVLRLGFAGYLDHEQRWRAKVGLPPNPVGGSGRAG